MTDTDLETVVAQMRRLGITTYKTANLEIVLGDAPHENVEKPVEKTAAQVAAERRERDDRILFAATSLRPKLKRPTPG